MTEFDTILANERAQQHAHTNPDLLAFALLTEISYENARAKSRSRLRLIIVTSMAAIMLLSQTLLLSRFDYTSAVNAASQFLTDFPYAITVVNLILVAAILLVRRYRWF